MKYIKNVTIFILFGSLLNCGFVKKHPLATGITVGLVGGAIAYKATHHSCPHSINGVPYDGTPPCPEYWPPDKGGKK